MVKKLVALAGAGALLLSVAAPVLALDGFCFGCWDPTSTSADVAIVKTVKSKAKAISGRNTQDNWGGNTATAGLGNDNVAIVDSSGPRAIRPCQYQDYPRYVQSCYPRTPGGSRQTL